jgi:hypothetical protein
MTQHQHARGTGSIRVSLCQTLEGLLEQIAGDSALVVGFEDVRQLLEALPMASEEFGLAINRLANARHYLQSGEHGAARYELRLLRRTLAN